MKLEGITIYLEKTLVVKEGDVIKDCEIGGASQLDQLILVPKETVDSGDYEVSNNHISVDHHKPKNEYEFIYRGSGG